MTTSKAMIAKVGWFPSIRSMGWAGLAALVGCAACCAIPILAAAGLGGGATAAIATLMWPGAELVMGGLAFVGVLAVAALRRRAAERRSCAVACSVAAEAASGGCGCQPTAGQRSQIYGSPPTQEDEPLACTFDFRNTAAAQAHVDGYRAAFTRLVGTERFPGGFRWIFRADPGLAVELKTLAEREHGCCRFLSFDVKTDGPHIVWETRAQEHATTFLEEYLQLPERLRAEPRPGHDVAVLERDVRKAGLVFTADSAAGVDR
jgi:hypothetical protein